jgi:S-formylglutathione hydrolase FrmB
MSLTGLPFLVVLIAVAAALIGATMALWNRWWWPWAVPMRLVCLLLVMVTGVVLAADVVNREYDFYSSFGDLFGDVPVHGTIVSTAGPTALAGIQGWHALYRPGRGHGEVITVRLAGARSGLVRNALVYLPAAYFQRSQAHRRFPVVELFHGYPGNPLNWLRQLHFDQTLDTEISAGRIPPLIAVIPTDNDHGHDSECVDAVGGQRNETYLAVDVPTDIQRQFRVLTTPRSWATLGYSTGGYCAVNLALHHPDRYLAAASLSGYYTPLLGRGTDALYPNAAARRFNSPRWWVAHTSATTDLYLVASRGDPEAMVAVAGLRHAAHNRWPLVIVTLPAGGHNFDVWYTASLAAFQWLGARLAAP